VGDVFVMRPGDFYLSGAVARTDVSLDGGVALGAGPEVKWKVPEPGDSLLVYVFEGKQATPAVPEDLADAPLLIPPQITTVRGG
jgi:hypothetical protein